MSVCKTLHWIKVIFSHKVKSTHGWMLVLLKDDLDTDTRIFNRLFTNTRGRTQTLLNILGLFLHTNWGLFLAWFSSKMIQILIGIVGPIFTKRIKLSEKIS